HRSTVDGRIAGDSTVDSRGSGAVAVASLAEQRAEADAGRFGGLGGVLRHVPGHQLLRHVAAARDRSCVELTPPTQPAGRVRTGCGRVDVDSAGGGPDSVVEHAYRRPRGW